MTRNDNGMFHAALGGGGGVLEGGFHLLTPHLVNYTECMKRWNELQSRNTNASPQSSPASQWPFSEVGTKVDDFPPLPFSRPNKNNTNTDSLLAKTQKCIRSISTPTTLLLARTSPRPRPRPRPPPRAPPTSTTTPPPTRRRTHPSRTQWWTSSCAMSAT